MCECWRGPYINVLSLEMSSHLNGENWTKVEVVWLRAKLNQWKICVGHYEKMEKWLPHHGNLSYRKIFNYWPPPQSLGLCFSNVDGNVTLASAIMKKWLPCHGNLSYCKISNYWPPKVCVSAFPSVDRNGKLALGIMKNGKWLPIHGTCCTENFQLRKVIIDLECWNWTKVFSLPHESPMCNFTLPVVFVGSGYQIRSN